MKVRPSLGWLDALEALDAFELSNAPFPKRDFFQGWTVGETNSATTF
jgi:hypothetical protein